MNIAQDIYYKYKKIDTNDAVPVFIDPATILIITSILINVVKLIKACRKKDGEVVFMAKYPTAFESRMLKRQIRKEMGWFEYMKNGDKMYNSIKSQLDDMSNNDIIEAYYSMHNK